MPARLFNPDRPMSQASSDAIAQNNSSNPISDTQRGFILASGSPRRLELMAKLGFAPKVRVSAVPEERGAGESPSEYTRRLALAKAEAVRDEMAAESDVRDWILAADTIVIIEDEAGREVVLEKPADGDEAAEMLGRLSGRAHVVETSYCWLQRSTGRSKVESVRAKVEFRELTPEMIARYVATGESLDKAGSYGIQEVGAALVRRIEGSYFTVVGLPVCEVVETLTELGGLSGFPFQDE
ncbi:septum formation protein [Bradymonas sediminis]|nr:septum formation protein [Bradymonas sediminis]